MLSAKGRRRARSVWRRRPQMRTTCGVRPAKGPAVVLITSSQGSSTKARRLAGDELDAHAAAALHASGRRCRRRWRSTL